MLRRIRRLRHRRPAVLVGGGLLGVAVLLLLWAAWNTWSLSRDLAAVESEAQVLRAALVRGDPDGARQALEDYQDAAESAEDRTDGPTWWTVERVPLVGDDAEGVEVAARVLADLGRDGLPPLVDAADQVTAKAFQPKDHVFPLEAVAAVQEPARQSEEAFAAADTDLGAVDTTGFTGPIRTQFEKLHELVTSGRSTLDSAYRGARLMPELLGADDPRHYLLVFQNNAEIRSAGGLAGSVSLIRAADGDVDIVEQEGTSQFGELAEPVLPVTRDERNLFGDILGTYFMNASLTPDIPRAAELMAARWTREVGGQVDGVFFVDPVAVSYLLSSLGSVEVPGYAPVDTANVVPAVENQIYLTTADREAQEDYQNAVAEAVFDAFAEGRGDPVDLIDNLVRAVGEGRVRMNVFDEEQQRTNLAGEQIAGELSVQRPGPSVGIYLNDTTESKMSYYLDYQAGVVARSCTGDRQDLVGTMTLTNDTPPDAASLPPSVTGYFPHNDDVPPGGQSVLIYLMSPSGGTVTDIEIDGRDVGEPAVTEYEDRSVASIPLTLDPGQSVTIEFAMRTGRSQAGEIRLDVTPGARAGTESEVVPSACRY